jgi:5-methylcytosine-specific restriction enzyme A
MASKAFKECNKLGCYKLTRSKYCETHAYIEKEQKKYYQKTYNVKRDYQNDKFYSSKGWKNKKEHISKRDNYMCQRCFHKFKKIVPRDAVHHIKKLKEYPQFRFRNSNLISLCDSCHRKCEDSKRENDYLQRIVDEKEETTPPGVEISD